MVALQMFDDSYVLLKLLSCWGKYRIFFQPFLKLHLIKFSLLVNLLEFLEFLI